MRTLSTLSAFWLALVLSLSPTVAFADEEAKPPQTARWSVGSDISPWFFNGYSVLVMLEPLHSVPQWRISGEVWGFDFPDSYIELNDANKDEGWSRRVNLGLALYMDWHFTKEWHAGLLFNAFQSTVKRSGVSGEASFWSGEILARAGYRWMPFGEKGFFLNPWISAGPLAVLSGEQTLGGEEYKENPIQVIGTVHTGWRF